MTNLTRDIVRNNDDCGGSRAPVKMEILQVTVILRTHHVADAQRRAADKPLWKHILDKHEGRLAISIFEHFSMIRTGVFVKPQRRKANEGVRISHLNPDTRMNSKDEFRQGTNITMRPVRGVGE